MQDKRDFYGYEVQSNGVTLEWTPDQRAAQTAFDKCRSSAKLYKHKGQGKSVIAEKVSKFAKLKDVARMQG